MLCQVYQETITSVFDSAPEYQIYRDLFEDGKIPEEVYPILLEYCESDLSIQRIPRDVLDVVEDAMRPVPLTGINFEKVGHAEEAVAGFFNLKNEKNEPYTAADFNAGDWSVNVLIGTFKEFLLAKSPMRVMKILVQEGKKMSYINVAFEQNSPLYGVYWHTTNRRGTDWQHVKY